jgi:PAS domain S-box-containing protein
MPDRINNENFQRGTEAPAFGTLAVNIPGIVYRVYLGERGRMAFFNGMLQQMTGYKADELTTGNVCSIDPIIFSEDRSSVLQAVNDAIRNNLPFEVEYRIHHKNGSLRYFLEKGSPVYGCDGKPEFIDGIILDITARKQTETALRESEARLTTVLENLPVGIWIVDSTGRVIAKNKAADLIWRGDTPLSSSLEDYVEYIAWDIETGKRLEKDDYPLSRTLRTGLPITPVELRIRRFDGTEGIIMMATALLRGPDGLMTGAVGLNVDITERKQAEETLRELNEELNEYAYALNHNLKAPLRAIHNYVNFLFEDLADNLQGKPKKYLQGIKDAITSSNKQFEDLERLYHIKNHLLNFESFEMCELLDEIKSLFKDTSDQNLVIAQNWPRFRSERFLLRQILLALINNGLKFNDADIKRIEIGWQAVADHGIEIFVRDNGIGIDPQYQQQIFDIFRRLHTESEYEGTGIGLAVVKRAVQRIGGKLRLESAVGEGSTFYINLPNSLIENNQA